MIRIIAHLDMDAFFAAVHERDNPRLRGRPIVVGADPKGGKGRGVVSTANYKAREYGIHSAMPISTAWRLAEEARKKGKPEVVFVAPDFRRYSEASRRVFAIVEKALEQACPTKFSQGKVGRVSIDEAYLDLSFAGSYERAIEISKKVKEEIKAKEQLTASIGIGPNKLIAKIASDMQKPDGLTIVEEGDAEKFLEPLSIRKIPGIGPKTEEMFKRKGVQYVRDLKRFSRDELHEMLGKWGLALYEKARGEDDSAVAEEREVKSISEQETFPEDTSDPNFVGGRLKALAQDIFRRFKKSEFKTFQRVVITVRFADFETKTSSRTLERPVTDLNILTFEAWRLLLPFFDKRENPRRKRIRLIGVRIEKLI